MDRIPDIDEERVAYWRAVCVAAAATEDQNLPPEQRRDREEVIPGSNLKRDDDVMFCGAIPMRVIGPGAGVLSFVFYYPAWFGDEIYTMPLQDPGDLTDRAPLDTQEAPMPIFPEPALLAARAAKNPSQAAAAERKRAARRRLEAFVDALPARVRERVRAKLIALGHLPPPPPWYCRLWLWLTGRG